jgi:hypothetical protein
MDIFAFFVGYLIGFIMSIKLFLSIIYLREIKEWCRKIYRAADDWVYYVWHKWKYK